MLILLTIFIGAGLAFIAPNSVLWARPALQPAFAMTMFFLGTLVSGKEVVAFLRTPMRPILGFAAQYTIMPLCAAVVSSLFQDPLVKTGIVLVGCMPGAMASNVMTVLLQGDLMLSVAMTTLATLACPVVIALWLPILADTRLQVPIGPMVWNATWMVVLPVVAGIALRSVKTQIPFWWNRLATVIASLAIILIILVVVASNRDRLAGLSVLLGLAMLGLNLSGYLLAFAVATLFGWPPAQRRTLLIEVSMQNAGLGSVLALQHLGEAGAVPSAFYTVLCVMTASFAIPLYRWVQNQN